MKAAKTLTVATLATLVVGSAVRLADAQTGVPSPPTNVQVRAASTTGTTPTRGVWIGKDELMARATSGAAWTKVLADANASPGTANVADQDNKHDAYTLAAALVAVRTGQASYRTKAIKGIRDAIGTEFNSGTRWLAISRNLLAYVVAADILDLKPDGNSTSDGTVIHGWIRGWLTKQLPDNNSSTLRGFRPFGSGSNADAQEGACYAAVAAYVGDTAALGRAWNAFRRYAGDPTAPDNEKIILGTGVEYGWAYSNTNPFAINPKGTTKMVPSGVPGAGTTQRIDGAIINDMRRGGSFRHPPGFTQYPWTGLMGFVPAAVVLQRAGYPAFEVADRAVLRTHDYLWWLRNATGLADWFDSSRGSEIVQLVNHYYGTSFPVTHPVLVGHTIGYTDWTHAGTR